jgi:enoyl-[acyl-carrier-protein] reductase (NADH)
MSSHGPDTYFPNYDYAAVTKAVMEVLVKYLNFHFFDKEVIFNMLRTRTLITDSWLATAGNDWTTFIERFEIPGTEVGFNEVAKTAYMLCSGYMDGIRGQTIVADKGYAFSSTLEYVYSQRERLGLQSHD